MGDSIQYPVSSHQLPASRKQKTPIPGQGRAFCPWCHPCWTGSNKKRACDARSQPAPLFSGTASAAIPCALITVASPARTTEGKPPFGERLPGPFNVGAGTGLSPCPGSLKPRCDAYFSRSQPVMAIFIAQNAETVKPCPRPFSRGLWGATVGDSQRLPVSIYLSGGPKSQGEALPSVCSPLPSFVL